MQKARGFTLIEVLIAMGLLMMMMFNMSRCQLSSLQYHRETLRQIIALNQLQAMMTVIEMHIASVSGFYRNWEELNQQLLPQGHGEIIREGQQSIVRIYWHSSLSHQWFCRSSVLPQTACLELEASI